MAITNTLKKQIDLPVFEWTRFAPAVSSAISCSTTGDNSVLHPTYNRYIYYLISATGFWRYDTWTDTYMQLTSPPIAPATWSSMKFAANGVEGLILSATSNTATIPAYFGKVYKGFDIRIVAGTGVGQRRIITDVSDPIPYDLGVPTTISNTQGAITITDTLKAWTVNQWAGYQVRIVSGTGIGQVRKILYNSATVLTLGDSVVSAYETFCNPGIFSPAIVTTAGAQSIYQIEASTVTVDSNWLVTPDATSRFSIYGGNIMLASSAAATPFYTLQQYDVLTDTWYVRTANTLNMSVVGTDGTIEKNAESSSIWEKGTATSGTTTTLVDTSKSWITNEWVGYYVRIFSGTGEGQLRAISANTANTLTWVSVGTAPDTTSQYLIDGFDSGTASSGTTTTIVDASKSWDVNRWKNYLVRVTSGTNKGSTMQILSNTATTLTLMKAMPSANDNTTVYSIQGDSDKIYMALGNNAAVLIHNTDDDLATFGRLQDSGAARQGHVQYASQKPIAITSLTGNGVTATCTTAQNHNLKTGYVVNVGGAITNTGLNATGVTITVTGATTFTYSNATNATATFTGHSTTTLTDSTKNWTNNQWAGYMVYMTTSAVTAATGLATGQALQIASNTATTLTFVTGTAPTNGVSRYVITPRNASGMMFNGIATGAQSTTTLTDSNVSAFSGTCSTSSTSNILTVSAVSAGYLGIGSVVAATGIPAGTVIIAFGPNTTGGVGTYVMSNTVSISGTALTSSGWAVNYFAGRRLKLIGSTGQSQEVTITSNTATVLTFGIITTAPVTLVTSYVILNQTIRSTGISLNWLFGTSDANLRGKRIIVAKGGAAIGFDCLDITTDRFDACSTTPQIETLTTGSMYAYDGVDRLYFTKDVTQRMYYLDVVTNNIHGASIYPYTAGATIIGNRMEIFNTEDGLKYLWLNRHSNAECFRTLLFY